MCVLAARKNRIETLMKLGTTEISDQRVGLLFESFILVCRASLGNIHVVKLIRESFCCWRDYKFDSDLSYVPHRVILSLPYSKFHGKCLRRTMTRLQKQKSSKRKKAKFVLCKFLFLQHKSGKAHYVKLFSPK